MGHPKKRVARERIIKQLTRWERAANLEGKALREERRLTMTEAAARCKVTRPAISQHEHQERGMTLKTLVKFARGFGMGPDLYLYHARRWLTKVVLWLLLREPVLECALA